MVGRGHPVRFHDEPRSVDAVVSTCSGAPPHGIVAVGDRPAVLAARLPRVRPARPSARGRCDKSKQARDPSSAAGRRTPTPRFVSTPVRAIPRPGRRVRYPAVIKPLGVRQPRGGAGRYGRRAHRRRRSPAPPAAGARCAHGTGRDARTALVEDFIPGTEYAIEALLDHGTLQWLALFDKPDPLDARSSRRRSTARRRRRHRSNRAPRGCRHGGVCRNRPASWAGAAECRISGDTIYVLEVAARPIGGLCSRALRFRPGWPVASPG